MYISAISASRSDIIDECLWKYYLKYVEYLKGNKKKNEESLNFGSYIHKIFEICYNTDDRKIFEKVAEEHKSTYGIQFGMKPQTEKCIDNFLKFNASLNKEHVSTEMAFEVFLDEKNDIKFRGVIDRIIKGTDGGYLVIDYKTSKRQKTKTELLTDKQMCGYAYAMNLLYGVPYSKIWCGHYYPLTNTFVTVQFTSMQVYQWKKKEIEKVWRIRKLKKGQFPAQRNQFCDFCEFKEGYCIKFNSQEESCKRIAEEKLLRGNESSEVQEHDNDESNPNDSKEPIH